MTLKAVLAAVRRSWIPVLVVVLVCALGGLAVAALTPARYQTQTQLLFEPASATSGTSSTATTPASGGSAVQTLQSQLPTYAALAETPTVLDPASKALGDGSTAQQLQGSTSASVVDDTAIVTVSTSGRSGQQAAERANAVAESLISQVALLDPTGAGAGQITGRVVEAPLVPGSSSTPGLLVDGAVGLLVGLVLAYLLVVVREALRRDDVRLQRA